MTKRKPPKAPIHADRDLFVAALTFTAAETGFPQRLIEKDYFATVVLTDLMSMDTSLVFKGGTCLAKVHSDFYRLSEDLDFAIPTPVDASRSTRSKAANKSKEGIANLAGRSPGIRLIQTLTGANNSTRDQQYSGDGWSAVSVRQAHGDGRAL